jgi:hypothetical protein
MVGLVLLIVAALSAGAVVETPPAGAAGGSVAAVTLTPTPVVGGVHSTWNLQFDTSSGGALVPGSTVTVAGPSGTDFTAVSNCDVRIASPPQSATSCAAGVATANGGASLIVTLGASPTIGNSAPVELDLNNLKVVNPAGGTPYSSITVATSVDTTQAAVGNSGTFTVPRPVSDLVFSPSTPVGGATGVTWNISFITSVNGALPGTGGIDAVSISAPSGTVFPTDRNQYSVSVGGGPNVIVSGSDVTVYVGGPIGGDSDVTIQIFNVTNPPAPAPFNGISLSTQTDTVPVSVTSASTFGSAQALSNVHFSANTLVGGATGAVWQWTFTTSSSGWLSHSGGYAFDPRGQITLTGPSGTVFSNDPNAYTVIDLTTGVVGQGAVRQDTITPGSATINLPSGWDIAGGDRVEVIAGNVTNPASGNESEVTVSTSSDPAPQADPSALAAFGGAGHVSTPAFTTTTTAAGATGVTWGLQFATSATGSLAYNFNWYGYATISITAPANTLPNNQYDYDIVDVTNGQYYSSGPLNLVTSGGHDVATITLRTAGFTIGAGDTVHIGITGVTNPSSGDFAGVEVATSSDPVAQAIGAPPSVSAALALSHVTFTPNTPAQSAPGASWRFDATTSATGTLVAGQSVLTASLPGGTFPTNGCGNGSGSSYQLYDLTTGAASDQSACLTVAGAGTSTVHVTVPFTVHGGDQLHLLVNGATNPASAAAFTTASVATSSDSSAAATNSGSFAPSSATSGVTVAPNDTAAGQTGVSWLVSFTAGSHGQLAPSFGTVTVASVTGSPFAAYASSSFNDATVTDLRTGQTGTVNPSTTDGSSAVITLPANVTVEGGDQVNVVLRNVTNPASGSFSEVSVSTSSDTASAAAAGSWNGTAVFSAALNALGFAAQSAAGGATTTWTLDAVVGSSGGLTAGTGTVTVSSSAGGLPTSCPANNVVFNDLTTGYTQYCPIMTQSATSITITVPTTVAPGDDLQIRLNGVTNPAGGTNFSTVAITSSASGANAPSPSGSFVAPQGVSSLGFSVSTAAQGATQVRWSTHYVVGPQGAMGASGVGTVTLAGPSGTSFPGAVATYFVRDLTNGSSGVPNTVVGGATAVIPVAGTDIEPGDQVAVEAFGVTNPSSGSFTSVGVSTSADTTPVSPASGSFVAPQGVGTPLLSPTSLAAGATGTDWVAAFTLSSSGRFEPDVSNNSNDPAVTLTVPAGTSFGGGGATLLDATSGAVSGVFVTWNSGAGTLTVASPFGAEPGDLLLLEVPNVTNPPAGPLSGVSVSTSPDPTPAPVTTAGSFVAPSPLSDVVVQPSTTAGGATGVNWGIGFTASATGGLFARYATITVTAPAGTVFVNNCYYYTVFDVSTGQVAGCLQPQITGGNTVTLTLSAAEINPGDQVEVFAAGVTNPPSGDFGSTTVATSSDQAAPAAALAVSSPNSVVGLTLAPSDPLGGAAGVSWRVNFSASATGALVLNRSSWTVQAPAGTVLPAGSGSSCYDYALEDLSTGYTEFCPSGSVAVAGTTVTVSVPADLSAQLSAGDQLRLWVQGVTNPAPGTSFTLLSASTSTDTVSAAAAAGSFTTQSIPPVVTGVSPTLRPAGRGDGGHHLRPAPGRRDRHLRRRRGRGGDRWG